MDRPGVVSMSGKRIEQAVDDILEPVWVRERRRAMRRWMFETGLRLAAGLLPLWSLCLVLRLVLGLTMPWAFFGFVTVLMTGAAFSQEDGREHLRNRRPARSPVA